MNPERLPTDTVGRLARQIYTVLGLGLLPKAPGTWGTLFGIPLYFLLSRFGWKAYLGGTLAVFLIGWWASARAERDFGRHDDSRVVVDEVLGYLVTMFLAPALPWAFLWGFALFRIFDIAKPGPVGWADRKCPGGLGVMLDDLLAGIFAWASLQLIGVIYLRLIAS
jgi:phosphatidylglycerophosphatase A